MKKIITLLKPFTMTQQIVVYEDGNKLDVKSSEMATLTQDICNFANQYSCNQVDLVGPREYAKKIADDIKLTALSQYGLNDLSVNVI